MDAEQTEMMQEMMPYAAFLDVQLLSVEPDEVRATMAWRNDLCTADGVLHGGAIMGFADTVGAVCAYLNLPDGAETTATQESKTNFFRPVTGGSIEAVSRPLHVGGNVIVVDVSLEDDEGRAVARTTQSQTVG